METTMSDATMNCLDVPCSERVTDQVERKLAGYDVGMIAAVSMGVMATARVVNLMAHWI